MKTQSKISIVLTTLLFVGSVDILTAQTTATTPPISPSAAVNGQAIGLQGYDPVAYFMHSAAMKGSSNMQATVAGETYQFVMAEHVNLFSANPEQYLPQFGGLCAMCLVNGQRVAGDPTQFVVSGNKLYFNANAATQEAFKKDLASNIASARNYYAPPTSATAAPNNQSISQANINTRPTDVRIDAAKYTANGELIFPADIEKWVALGASLGMGYNEQTFDPKAPGSFVIVAMEPKAYDYFKNNGHFADGTLFTRTSYEAAQRMSTNRAGFVMGDFNATEVHVVDRKKFKDGFNFAIFGANQKSAAILPDGNGCVSCHVKNGAYEAVFAQFYPTIRHQIPAAALAASMQQEQR